MLRKDRPASAGSNVVGIIDIGTSKICCLIASGIGQGSGSDARVLGVGHHRSRGLKAGVIVDLDEAEQAVRSAVGQAERMSGVTIDQVQVGVDCGRIRSSHFAASTAIESGSVSEADIGRALHAGRSYIERTGRSLLLLGQLGYRLDGTAGIREPRGMAGQKLSVDLHAVTCDEAPLRNLMLLIGRCHLRPVGLVPSGLAIGLAVTTDDERRLGATVIDIGGGTTTLAIFAEGQFVYTSTLPVGGNHVTYDLSRRLQTTLAEAERIKTLYGSVVAAPSDEWETVSYPLAGEGAGQMHQVSRGQIRDVIEPRMKVILGLAREALEQSGVGRLGSARLILTGGASQLVGLSEMAANQLGVAARVGRPLPWGGVPSSVCTPGFAVALGLATAASMPGAGIGMYRERNTLDPTYLDRVGSWLQRSF